MPSAEAPKVEEPKAKDEDEELEMSGTGLESESVIMKKFPVYFNQDGGRGPETKVKAFNVNLPRAYNKFLDKDGKRGLFNKRTLFKVSCIPKI
mgnify:CR=1 FL=1